MKRKICLIFIILFFPIYVNAYSEYLIPGGENIGIDIESKGLVVVGFYKVNDKYIGKEYFKVGDTITKIGNKYVYSLNDIKDYIEDELSEDNTINVEIKRNNKLIEKDVKIVKHGNTYKTGLYIKDSISGIGTITYIDPVTKIYGALGHEITFNETNSLVEIKNGYILESMVTGINRSENGRVGSKRAKIDYKNKIGTINKNTIHGIFGTMYDIPNKKTMKISNFNEIELGDAYIYTVTDKNKINKYKIKIIDIYNDRKDDVKSFGFEVIDKALLSKAGGIVQGMSGSPIIQNNKIIGGVTHVLVDNVILGYGIYIKKMLEEGEK